MAGERTLVTELGTALGTLAYPDVAAALNARPDTLAIESTVWDRLDTAHASGDHAALFTVAYRNGQAFAAAADGLRGRPPRLIEWTGGRRPSGDEVAPIDLAVDHVYLVSCKYLSANIANPSPARLFDGLLATTGSWDRADWYATVAPDEYQQLYLACRQAAGLDHLLPVQVSDLTGLQRLRLSKALPGRRYPPQARDAYSRLCRAVSDRSARRWADRLGAAQPERVLARMLRIGNAPYFLLGAHSTDSLRIRVATAWDWRQRYRFQRLTVIPGEAGQPQVDWAAHYIDLATGTARHVNGHIEIRWSHGRFRQPPEAKVYLDTPVKEVPGYHPLGD